MVEGNILVIDDELVICEFLRDLLEDRGWTVNFALSGQEGIKAFQAGGCDVVICDLKISDMDGIDVIHEIKRVDPDSVVIIITGYPSFETVQASLREGAYDYITKPVNINEISFVIKRAVAFRDLTLTNRKLTKELEQQNIKLEKKVKERTEELSILYSVGLDILSTLKLDEVLQIIVDRVCAVLELEICSVLLVDKEPGSLKIRFVRGLENEIKNTKIKFGEPISGWVAEHKEPVLVADIETDLRFRKRNQEKYYTHSFISVPLVIRGEVIGVINVNNKRSRLPFTENDFRFIRGIANEAAIAVENAQLYASLEDTYLRTVMALASAIDAKDHYTKTHSEHVTKFATAMAREMGLCEKEIKEIEQACQLHDLGKIGIQDSILTKPGQLTAEEWDEMKLHSLKSVEILKPLSFLGGVIKLVEQHHERYDGKGYPFGIKGENIKVGARIIAVADSFDAMTTDRTYRRAFTDEEAIKELKNCSGTQFDPKVVEAFLKVLEKTDMLNTLHQA